MELPAFTGIVSEQPIKAATRLPVWRRGGKGSAVPGAALIGAVQRTEVRMTAFSDSYVLRVLLAAHVPARGVDLVARRRRKMLDPYRPEPYYMRGCGTPR